MKYLTALLSLLVLTACGGGGAATDGGSNPVAASAALPTVTPTVAPTASPSPTPTPASWGGFSGGGVFASPYQVTTPEDVTHIADFPGAYFELTGNIDMDGIAVTPIPVFSGVIQGHHYSLRNLTIQTTGGNSAALILTLSGIITQLYMSNILIESASQYAAAYAIDVSGTISNSQISSGTINSHLGGNGWNTGTGNPFYVNRVGGATITGDQSTVDFNGNSFFGTF